jgi:hypothetical protein
MRDGKGDEGNRPKLARRGILPTHVEAVSRNGPQWRPNKRSGSATWVMTGRDDGGRPLRVNILWADEDAGRLRAISAWIIPAKRLKRRR